MTTQLYNVFNQAIPAWIVTLLILNNLTKSHIFIYSLLVLYAPLPFIGLFPFILQKSFRQEANWRLWLAKPTDKYQKKISQLFFVLKENLSVQNVIVGGFVMIVSFIFMYSNTGVHEHGFIWEFYPQTGKFILLYVIFCLNEFLILGLCIYTDTSDKALLGLTLIILLLIPLYKYGTWNDFSTRTSIPALIILFILMIKSIVIKAPGLFYLPAILRKCFLVLILMVGSITPIHEIHRSVDAIIAAQGSLAPQDTWISFDYGGDYNKMKTVTNFVINDPDNHLFFQILSK